MTQNSKYDLYTAFWQQLSQHLPVVNSSGSDVRCQTPFKIILKSLGTQFCT